MRHLLPVCMWCSKINVRKSPKMKVGKNALKGIKSTAKIKVPAKKVSAYKKILKKKMNLEQK